MVEDDIVQIRRAYPELAIHSVRPITDSGQFNKVIILNESLIFRFPRSPYVAEAMMREVRILQAVKRRVSLPIPDPIYVHTGQGSEPCNSWVTRCYPVGP